MRDMMNQVDNALQIQIPNYSSKNLDTETLTTTRFGLLTPTFLMETVPGGKYSLGCEVLTRFPPLASPLMHRCMQKTMYFFVPYRILWDGWENFIMQKDNPLTGLPHIHPYYKASDLFAIGTGLNGVSAARIADYFGIKTPDGGYGSLATVQLNPFPFAAYQAIYNRWFRHKTVEDPIDYKLEDGLLSPSDLGLSLVQRIATFEDDYFNSSLPTPQMGEPSEITDESRVFVNKNTRIEPFPGELNTLTNGAGYTMPVYQVKPQEDLTIGVGELWADVSITIEEIRRADALQKYLETSNHVGNYIDYLKAFFNVDFPDGRAQEPEYIGGDTSNIMVTDVINQSDANQGRVVGNAASINFGEKYQFTALEHGMIIGLTLITYKPTYVEAKCRLHLKSSPFDYFNPQFDHLGEQVVLDGELNKLSGVYKETFGYVPRHFEYRSSFNSVTGEMATTYAHWHLARNYNINLNLSESFYKVLDERRIFQVDDEDFDPIILQVYNNVKAYLPMGALPQPTI